MFIIIIITQLKAQLCFALGRKVNVMLVRYNKLTVVVKMFQIAEAAQSAKTCLILSVSAAASSLAIWYTD